MTTDHSLQTSLALARASLRLSDGRFDCRRWRSLVRSVAWAAHPKANAICPFGFEVTGDPAFLKFKLRRYYVYVGVPMSAWRRRREVLEIFGKIILARLREAYPEFARSLHGMLVGSRGMTLGPTPGGVLHLIARPLALPLVRQWAHYLLVAPGVAIRNELKEMSDFSRSKAARSYVFQISLIFHHLLTIDGLLKGAAAANVRRCVSYEETLDHRGRVISADAPVTPHEAALLRLVVAPQLEAVAKALASPLDEHDEIVKVSVRDFHSATTLTSYLSRRRLESLTAKIEKCYELYPPSCRSRLDQEPYADVCSL